MTILILATTWTAHAQQSPANRDLQLDVVINGHSTGLVGEFKERSGKLFARDCRKIGGHAATAAGGCGSLAGWKRCPKPEPSMPL